jgi:hypothetical protein
MQGINLWLLSHLVVGWPLLKFPEHVQEDPLVRLIYLRKEVGWMECLPNISASSLIAGDEHFLGALGAIPVSHLQLLGEGSWYYKGSWTL